MTMDADAEIFGTLSEDTCNIDDDMDGVKRFVCSLYGMPKFDSVNDTIFAIFQ